MYWFLYDSNGNIQEAQIVDTEEWPNLNGYAGAAGPFEKSDTTARDAFDNNSHYIVQNGALVKTVTSGQLLSESRTQQNQRINAGYMATILAGFQVNIGGTVYTLGWQQSDRDHLAEARAAVLDGTETYPIPYADINGTPVYIPDHATLLLIEQTASNFYLGNIKQLRVLRGQVLQATTPDAAYAVKWSAAAYNSSPPATTP